MKVIYSILATLLLAACSEQQTATPDTAASVAESAASSSAASETATQQAQLEKVKIGLIASPTGNAPLNFVDEKGQMQGFEYDVLQEIAKRAGYSFEYEYQAREQLFDQFKEDKFKLLAGSISLTDERKNTFVMSNPYLDAYPVTLLSKDASIKKLTDIKAKSIVALKDSPMDTNYQILNDFKGAEDKISLELTKSDWLSVQSMLANKATVAISNSTVIPYYYTNSNSKEVPLYFSIDYDYPQEHYGFIINKDDKKLLENVNKYLAEMKADGTYQTLYKKWF
ncbi:MULTISPECIES: substrate-binding periplasmic protein [unclassified Acinetobacter]|uniref:substrate-binding periplasmic protein n=1 Tax=unclassified Acinetobacter TaxID=196816 RepID=UPI0035B916F3